MNSQLYYFSLSKWCILKREDEKSSQIGSKFKTPQNGYRKVETVQE